MPLPADSSFVHVSVPNRSLAPSARRWVLAGIAATVLLIAGAAMVIGAWLVMPFAGVEIAVLALAFRLVALHDGDFERLEIGDYEVRVEGRDARRETRFVAHRPWARVVVRERGARCTLVLAYAGRMVPLGRLLTDEGRRRLAGQLRGWIPVKVK